MEGGLGAAGAATVSFTNPRSIGVVALLEDGIEEGGEDGVEFSDKSDVDDSSVFPMFLRCASGRELSEFTSR